MDCSSASIFRFPSLAGRTVVITGTTRGIGKALLPGLLGQGVNLIVLNRRPEVMDGIRQQLNVPESRLQSLCCDLADPASVKVVAEEILARNWPIDGLIHNAAIDPRHRFEDANGPWEEVFQINFSSAAILTRMLLPRVRQSTQGRVVFFGSVLAGLGGACVTAYASSKGAIGGLTASLAHELKRTSITVNCIVPGAISVEKEVLSPEVDRQLIDWQAVPRRLVPDDLLGLLCLLLSEQGGGITGQTITVDGGIVHPLADPDFQGRSL